jgi:hypothetical protein
LYTWLAFCFASSFCSSLLIEEQKPQDKKDKTKGEGEVFFLHLFSKAPKGP